MLRLWLFGLIGALTFLASTSRGLLQLVRAVKGRYDRHDFNPHYG